MSISESHLAQEAVAALVDGELAAAAAGRAARHLAGCAQCRMAVQAQREAKDALHACSDVAVPGDLMSRLCAIPFTADVPGTGGDGGTLSAVPGGLTLSGSSGSWSVDLAPRRGRGRNDSGRWLRRGLTGTLVGLGVGVSALVVALPNDDPARVPSGPVAGPSVPEEQTRVLPPIVRPLTADPAGRVAGPDATVAGPGATVAGPGATVAGPGGTP